MRHFVDRANLQRYAWIIGECSEECSGSVGSKCEVLITASSGVLLRNRLPCVQDGDHVCYSKRVLLSWHDVDSPWLFFFLCAFQMML